MFKFLRKIREKKEHKKWEDIMIRSFVARGWDPPKHAFSRRGQEKLKAAKEYRELFAPAVLFVPEGGEPEPQIELSPISAYEDEEE